MATGGMSFRYSADHAWRQRDLAAAVPVTVAPSRLKTAATWLFVLPVLTEGVLPDVVKLQIAGLVVLAFVAIGSSRPLPYLAVERIFAVAAVLTLTVAGYLAFSSWPQGTAAPRTYDGKAAMWVLTYVLVAVFAVLFFEAGLFERVMWSGATVTLAVSVAACVLSRATGHLLLVNPNYGALRMDGTQPEPSGWAPLLTVVLLLSLRRRSRWGVFLVVAGLVLADSPTCMLVMGVTVPLYWMLTSSWRNRAPLLAMLLIVVPVVIVFVQRSDYQAWLDSPDTAKVAVGRLVSGIRNVESGGEEGQNGRFQDTQGILTAVRDNGWMRGGAGPGVDSVQGQAAAQGPPAAVNSLWVAVLMDFGEWGVAVLGVLVLAAAWRMRRCPRMAALLLPFMAASMVNTSSTTAPFAGLGVMLFALGWVGPRAQRR